MEGRMGERKKRVKKMRKERGEMRKNDRNKEGSKIM